MGTALSLAMLATVASAAPESVVYHEGFETGEPKWAIWAKNADEPCTIHVLGPSGEKAFAGERSLKLDLTFHDGSYCYFGTPVKVPAAGNLKLSGYLCVDQIPSGVHVGLGWNVDLPPSGHSGCSTIETLSKPTGDWRRFEVDLAEVGERTARGVLGSPYVLRYLNRIALMFSGKFEPGGHVVVYVDDVKITGQVPADYETAIEAEIDRTKAAQNAKVEGWNQRAREARSAVEKLRSDAAGLPSPIREHAVEVADAAATTADAFLADTARLLKQSRWLRPADENVWTERLAAVQSAAETLRRLPEYAGKHPVPYVLYTRPAITDARLLPTQMPVPASVGDTIRLTATPGEYESATFAVFACRELNDVELVATDLERDPKSGSGTIPGSAVDLKIVKVWYQAGIGSIGAGRREPVLVPELLLNDDDLIRVDTENRHNLMRHQEAGGQETYVSISDPDPEEMPDVAPRDAKTLQPFNIPAQSLKQVWVTVRVPPGTPPGRYQGAIHVRPRGQPETAVAVQLRVLPFELEPTTLVQSIYYRAKLGANRHPHTVNSEFKTQQQLEAELADMFAHGLTSPGTYQPFDAALPKVLEIRNRVGFRSGPLFTLGESTGTGSDPGHLASLEAAVGKWRELAGRYGHESVYFYGQDEVRGERLEA
ncbi:MAG: hypothetical protein ABIP48_22335, partial [Planctomycetota bacterium]